MKQILLIFAALLIFASCRTTKQVTESYAARTDTLRLVQLQRDSIYLRDSVFVSVEQKGDTVYLTKSVTKYKLRDRWRTDTVYKAKTDTVTTKQVVVQERQVTKFPWWAKLLTAASAVMSAVAFVGYVAGKK